MGFTAALLNKKGEDVSAQLLRMMRFSSRQRGDGYGFSTPEGVKTYSRIPDVLDFFSDSMLGYKLIKTVHKDTIQPVSQYGYAMIFEGRLWTELSDLSVAADRAGSNPKAGLHNLIERGNGSFAAAFAEEGRILCGRDHIGIVPLYIGESEALVGAASNMKMLWSVGVDPKPLPPGCIADISKRGIKILNVKKIHQPSPRKMSIEDAVAYLDSLLSEAVEDRSKGSLAFSLGFSGGIDSSLLAYYLKKCGTRVDLICVGVEDSAHFEEAEKAAEGLDLPIRLEFFSTSQIDEDLDVVLSSVEEANPMKIGVALPLYWAAESAAYYGSRIFFSGNGSDELFGGYLKYVKEYASKGDNVTEMMFRDLFCAHEINNERDCKVCSDLGIELRLPFMDVRIIEFALSLPPELKVTIDEIAPRKPLLRALARRIGLPEEIISKQKRAIQYSTGVNQALKSLARLEGKTLSRYLSDRFKLIKAQWA